MVSELLLGGRWLLGLALISAGLSKLSRHVLQRVEEAIRDYRVIPGRLVRPVAAVLPRFELFCGALLCLGLLVVPVAGLVAALLATFAVSVSWHVLRGRRFDCGCGARSKQISWQLAAKDAGLSALALSIAVGPSAGLALWPGWGSAHVTASAASLIPVPLITILAILSFRLAISVRDATLWSLRTHRLPPSV